MAGHLVAPARLSSSGGQPAGADESPRAEPLPPERVSDGVWLVELAALADDTLVPHAVAAALALREQPGRPLLETLVAALRPRRLLLVLDNCEHLVEACAALAAALLHACPHLRILATSREALRVTGEVRYPVPGLAVPPPAAPPEDVPGYDAVRLCAERAAAVAPGFRLTAADAPAVAHVCRRLDGLPLALELATARVRALSVAQVLGRLDDSLRLLTGGNRAGPTRQRTLRAALAWSHDLLPPAEQALFRRLAVFAGGWTLEAAEAVCADEDEEQETKDGSASSMATGLSSLRQAQGRFFVLRHEEVLEALLGLVEKSLVVAEALEDGAVRYRFLETLRAYAVERLAEAAEAAAMRRRHAGRYLALAEEGDGKRNTADEGEWLRRLRQEHANLRAALAWALEHDGALAVRLAAALWWFWDQQGTYAVARERLAAALARGVAAPAAARARALAGAQQLAYAQGDVRQATAFGEEALALARLAGEPGLTVLALADHATLVDSQGDHRRALALAREALALARQVGAPVDVATALHTLGRLAYGQGDFDLARSCFEENLTLRRELGDTLYVASAYAWLGLVAMAEGAYEVAHAQFAASLTLRRETGHAPRIAASLEGFAALAVAQGSPERAARLLGAAAALRKDSGVPVPAVERPHYERTLEAAQAQLEPPAFAAAWAEGRAMAIHRAVEYALEGSTPA